VTAGIYQIRNVLDGKRYIGKSINIEQRLGHHRYSLSVVGSKNKNLNRHLYAAVCKYGIANFAFEVVEYTPYSDESLLADRELFWMDHFNTCEREQGYNLRRDSSTHTYRARESIDLHRATIMGAGNPNFGNNWDDTMRREVGVKVAAAHARGCYDQEWKNKIGEFHRDRYAAMTTDERSQFATTIKIRLQKISDFGKYDYSGVLLQEYGSVDEIRAENPDYKWQNIYAACNDSKPTAYGFMWRRFPSGEVAQTITPLIRKSTLRPQ